MFLVLSTLHMVRLLDHSATDSYSISVFPLPIALPPIALVRAISTVKGSILPIANVVLTKLVEILTVVCKNPSQPHFNHFLFEAISGLTK